jgi:N-acetylneuraminate synthase
MKRSLVARQKIRRGDVFKAEMFAFKRPASGLPPKSLPDVIGKAAACDIEVDTIITRAHVGAAGKR